MIGQEFAGIDPQLAHIIFSASVFFIFLTESIEGAKFVKVSSILILALTTFLIFRWFIQFNTRIFAILTFLFTLRSFPKMASSFQDDCAHIFVSYICLAMLGHC